MASEPVRFTTDTRHHVLISSKKWEWALLKHKCEEIDAHGFYQQYRDRLRLSNISFFAIVYTIVIFAYSLVLFFSGDKKTDLIDIGTQLVGLSLILPILFLNHKKTLVQRYPSTHLITSWIVSILVILSDVGFPYYMTFYLDLPLLPSYECVLIAANYVFFPLTELQSIFLGTFITITYLVFHFLVEYSIADELQLSKMPNTMSLIVSLVCLNFICFMYKVIRILYLRMQCIHRVRFVQHDITLKEIREKENRILASFIPTNTADEIIEDIKLRVNWLRKMKRLQRTSDNEPNIVILSGKWDIFTKNCYTKTHDNVTIFYADLVNFSTLSSTLDVKTLVATLHELIVKFDEECDKYRVQRIKFFGDTFFCVANVSIPNELHARSCVECAFAMIEETQKLCGRRKINVNLRIGIHSGSVSSGIIGARKWYFDIWSKDVELTNIIQFTGIPGRVHVSKQTLELLENNYIIENGTIAARSNEMLKQNEIRTNILMKLTPLDLTRVLRQNRTSLQPYRNFSQSTQTSLSIEQRDDLIQQTLEKDIDAIPLNGLRYMWQSRSFVELEMIFLTFKNWSKERKFLSQPDCIFKYSFLTGIITTIGIFSIPIIYSNYMKSIFNMNYKAFWVINGLVCLIVIGMIIITWYQKIWMYFLAKSESSRPHNNFSMKLYNWSHIAQTSLKFRVTAYLLVVGLQLISFMYLVISELDNDFRVDSHDMQYFNPDAIVQCVVLNLGTCFLFTHIPYPFKFFIGTIVTGSFIVVIEYEYRKKYEFGMIINNNLSPKFSYIALVVIQYGLFLIMSRHGEYIAKLNFYWRKQLSLRHKEIRHTKETIRILVRNILPVHISDIFLLKNHRTDLYWEVYDEVAVLFATFVNFTAEAVNLEIFNEIICEFDEILNYHYGFFKIEKIKLSRWTYTAACGLGTSRIRDSTFSAGQYGELDDNFAHDMDPFRRESLISRISFADTQGRNPDGHVVPVMIRFAIKLLNTMKVMNYIIKKRTQGIQFEGSLRIGVASGPTMAGIVGMDKLHYDLWGNAVNIASRMDQTGVPGQIQVTERVANTLLHFGMNCTYRGKVDIKGYGEMKAYFVDYDDDWEIIELAESESELSEGSSLGSFL